MSIPLDLLKLTDRHAPGFAVYGGPGLWKTYTIHSCPYPILLHDFERGAGSLIPWTRARREWNEPQWTRVTQEERLAAFAMLPHGDPAKGQINLQLSAKIKPNPLIDIISYDVFEKESYNHFVGVIGSTDLKAYSTVALDSLQELSVEVQSFAKGGGEAAFEPISGGSPMIWGAIQERTAIALRRLRAYRAAGVFIYLTGSEDIQKDYVTDPRSKPRGSQQEEAYSIKGTINLPGKLAGTVPHLVDILAHARALNGEPVFVTAQEPLPGGSAHWEAKDRFGRLDKYMAPNIREFFNKLYGAELAKTIYDAGKPTTKVATEEK